MSIYNPYFMDGLNGRMPRQFLLPSKVDKFFGNYDLSAMPALVAERAVDADIYQRHIFGHNRDSYPLHQSPFYMNNIDKGMIYSPYMKPEQYIMPQNKGYHHDYEYPRTQYSLPRPQEEQKKFDAFNELMKNMRKEESTEEDEEETMYRLYRKNT